MWRTYLECTLADETGMVTGSFYSKTRIEEKQFYELSHLKVKMTGRTFELLETSDTTLKVVDRFFKPKFKWIER